MAELIGWLFSIAFCSSHPLKYSGVLITIAVCSLRASIVIAAKTSSRIHRRTMRRFSSSVLVCISIILTDEVDKTDARIRHKID